MSSSRCFVLGAGNDQKVMAGKGVGRVGRGRLGEGNREGEMGRISQMNMMENMMECLG